MDMHKEKMDRDRILIIQHTKINMQIRKKLKVMIHKLPVPEPIENIILNYIGLKRFTHS